MREQTMADVMARIGDFQPVLVEDVYPEEDDEDDDVSLATPNPNIRRTRLAAKQLTDDGKSVFDVMRRRGVARPIASGLAKIVDRGTVTRPNARLAGHRLSLSIRVERDREALYRAAYVLKASERVQAAVDGGADLSDALAKEQRYFNQHESARKNRLEAATNAQRAGAWFGQPVKVDGNSRTLLGWYLNPLLNNDPECVVANRHNFYAEEGTSIGFPGAVHPNCGCYAGEPIYGAGLVDDALRAVNVATLVTPKLQLSRRKKTA